MQHNPAPGPEHRIFAEGEAIVHAVAWSIRDMGDAFLQMLESIGDSRELNLAKTKVEEAVMWAVRGIPADIQQPAEPLGRNFLADLYDTIAAALAAKVSGDNPTYDQHLSTLDQEFGDLTSTESAQGDRISAIEAGLQKIATAVAPPPPPTPAPGLSVSPAAITGTAGQAVSGSLSVSGGTAPYNYSSSLTDVTVDGSGNVSGTPAAAESGTITVTDASTPPIVGTVTVTIVPAAPAATDPTA